LTSADGRQRRCAHARRQAPIAGPGPPRRLTRNEENGTVKRKVAALAGVATLGVGAYLGSHLWAQQTYQQPAQQQAPLQTRIALVNLDQVIKGYDKYKTFEESIKAAAKGYQDQWDRQRQLGATKEEML